MKKFGSMMAIVAALGFALTFSAAANAATTWQGWISDSLCGAKGASASHKACAITCVTKKGAKYVFVNSADKSVLPITNQAAVKESDLGHEVKVTGHLNKGKKSIHVNSIASAM